MFPTAIRNSEQEVLRQAVEWLDAGHQVELVTVVRTWGSAPRPIGSMAVVRQDGVLVGSVSGGCVEKQLAESLRGKRQGRVFTHHIDDDEARRFGLTCGGKLELLFENLETTTELRQILSALEARQRVQRKVDVASGKSSVSAVTQATTFDFDGNTLLRVFGPEWRLLLIGAGQLSRYTAEFALALDYEVVVCEPRKEFYTAWNVPGSLLVDDSPDDAVLRYAVDARSAVLALTHDPNHDDLALLEGLPGQAFYVGALGSRRNHEKRCGRLLALGASTADLQRLHGPVGLDIGSRTSAEIAISIVADVIQHRARLAAGTKADSQ